MTPQTMTPTKQNNKRVYIVFGIMFASPFVLSLYILAQLYATLMRFH